MSRDRWEGPTIRYLIYTLLLAPVLFVIPLAVWMVPPYDKLVNIAIILVTIDGVILLSTQLARRQLLELWYSNSRFVSIPFEEVRPRMEMVLSSSDLPYKAKPVSDPMQSVRFEVNHSFTVELLKANDWRKSVVIMWPVNDLTRRDVDGLKRSIDAAFPPAR